MKRLVIIIIHSDYFSLYFQLGMFKEAVDSQLTAITVMIINMPLFWIVMFAVKSWLARPTHVCCRASIACFVRIGTIPLKLNYFHFIFLLAWTINFFNLFLNLWLFYSVFIFEYEQIQSQTIYLAAKMFDDKSYRLWRLLLNNKSSGQN